MVIVGAGSSTRFGADKLLTEVAGRPLIEHTIEAVRPHVHVNGAEYGEHCIEAATVRAGGGRLHLVERIGGLSTSAVVEKISRAS